MKAWRRELHKWDVMENIGQVAVPPPKAKQAVEVESGEVKSSGGNSNEHSYGSWANQLPPPVKLVTAPVQALASNISSGGGKSKKSESTTEKGPNPNFNPNSEGLFSSFAAGTELDSPAGKDRGRGSGNAIGEDVEALEGVDYDCEAPSDCDEDVL